MFFSDSDFFETVSKKAKNQESTQQTITQKKNISTQVLKIQRSGTQYSAKLTDRAYSCQQGRYTVSILPDNRRQSKTCMDTVIKYIK